VRDHSANGRDLHVFEQTRRGHLRFIGPFVCAGFQWDDDAEDASGAKRRAIVFELVPLADVDASNGAPAPPGSGSSLADLRAAAEAGPDTGSPKHSKRRVYARSRALKLYVRKRAAGTCEGCEKPAPFKDRAGDPYLEPHHIRRISDGGPDDPRWVIALCPGCHARVHYGEDGDAYNATLEDKLPGIEAAAT
jgi:5-methylcytosine-specific restriction protein A